jgi:hypothetical protein
MYVLLLLLLVVVVVVSLSSSSILFTLFSQRKDFVPRGIYSFKILLWKVEEKEKRQREI